MPAIMVATDSAFDRGGLAIVGILCALLLVFCFPLGIFGILVLIRSSLDAVPYRSAFPTLARKTSRP